MLHFHISFVSAFSWFLASVLSISWFPRLNSAVPARSFTQVVACSRLSVSKDGENLEEPSEKIRCVGSGVRFAFLLSRSMEETNLLARSCKLFPSTVVDCACLHTTLMPVELWVEYHWQLLLGIFPICLTRYPLINTRHIRHMLEIRGPLLELTKILSDI